MTAEQRERVQSDTEALIPGDVLAAATEYTRLAVVPGADFDPKDLRPEHIVRYLKTSVRQWDEDRVLREAEDAGPWGDTDLAFLGEGDNLYNLTVGDVTSYVKGGFAGSEFGLEDPPAPEATVQAIVARVERSIEESEAVIIPVFGALVRLLKIKAEIPKLNKADKQKTQRMKLARHGKSGGYLASNNQKKDDDNDADGTVTLLPSSNHSRNIFDRVMTLQIKAWPTNLHTRASNFLKATGRSKDHELIVRTSGEFLDRVTSIGSIIIRDHFKVIKDRVFKPADLGGIAGGTSPRVVHEWREIKKKRDANAFWRERETIERLEQETREHVQKRDVRPSSLRFCPIRLSNISFRFTSLVFWLAQVPSMWSTVCFSSSLIPLKIHRISDLTSLLVKLLAMICEAPSLSSTQSVP